MLFSSFAFLLFFPAVFFLYWLLFPKHTRYQNILLLLASYFFYGWWIWKFIPLLIFSTLLDYCYGFGAASVNRRKARLFVWLGIINNIAILFVFKYFNFFSVEISHGLSLLGFHTNPLLLDLLLPLGVSFYTFHGMSYLLDVYHGRLKPITNIVDYSVFVCFFPLLIAGPIERANHLLPQIQTPRKFSYIQCVDGCRLILWGFFKKIVIADTLAIMTDDVFAPNTVHGSLVLITGAIVFGFQIYADFSGYTDIAIGLSKLLGIELLSNFRFPYFSRTIAEFWRRWHISLTTWFRDYLYIPLGGSRQGKAMAVRNTFIIFLLSGFWHGASWNFIIWGFIHAILFLPLLLTKSNRMYNGTVVAAGRSLPSVQELLQMLLTFACVSFAWIFFRIRDTNDAFAYIKGILHNKADLSGFLFYKTNVALICLFICIDWYLRRNERNIRVPRNTIVRWGIYMMLVFVIYLFWGSNNTPFIYFQF